jgi:RNA polymerase sigma-70 factor (ECF subfamily)
MSSLHNQIYDLKINELQYQIAAYEDQTAYKTLFFTLFPSLQNFAFSIVKSRVLAEEIASDMLLEVWIRRQKLMEIENLKLYLFTGTKHAAINKLRQENKHSRFCLENLHVEFISDYVNPEELTELHELESNIARAVKELPPACQLIYKLAKEDRLKYKDIAQLLDLSIKTIDHQLAIALKKIGNAIQLSAVKKNR